VTTKRFLSHTHARPQLTYESGFRHLGHCFTEPDDYDEGPVSRILHVVRSVGLLKGSTEKSAQVAVQGPAVRPAPYLLLLLQQHRIKIDAILTWCPLQSKEREYR
jgi:hypothetical protein